MRPDRLLGGRTCLGADPVGLRGRAAVCCGSAAVLPRAAGRQHAAGLGSLGGVEDGSAPAGVHRCGGKTGVFPSTISSSPGRAGARKEVADAMDGVARLGCVSGHGPAGVLPDRDHRPGVGADRGGQGGVRGLSGAHPLFGVGDGHRPGRRGVGRDRPGGAARAAQDERRAVGGKRVRDDLAGGRGR